MRSWLFIFFRVSRIFSPCLHALWRSTAFQRCDIHRRNLRNPYKLLECNSASIS